MRIFVSFTGEGYSTTHLYKGDNLTEILKEIVEDHNYTIDYEDEDFPEELLDDDETLKDYLLDYIEERNGDGCDYIISIVDLSSGNIIFASDEVYLLIKKK